MNKKIVVVTGSPRADGNSEILADAFSEGARGSGNTVSIFHAGRMNIHGCIDCKYCFSHDGECMQKDDMQDIYTALRQADVLVLAGPVYWYGMTSQMKAMIDRMFAGCKMPFPFKAIALLLVCGDTDIGAAAPAIAHFKAISHYMKWENIGIILQEGVHGPGEICGKMSLSQARDLGISIH